MFAIFKKGVLQNYDKLTTDIGRLVYNRIHYFLKNDSAFNEILTSAPVIITVTSEKRKSGLHSKGKAIDIVFFPYQLNPYFAVLWNKHCSENIFISSYNWHLHIEKPQKKIIGVEILYKDKKPFFPANRSYKNALTLSQIKPYSIHIKPLSQHGMYLYYWYYFSPPAVDEKFYDKKIAFLLNEYTGKYIENMFGVSIKTYFNQFNDEFLQSWTSILKRAGAGIVEDSEKILDAGKDIFYLIIGIGLLLFIVKNESVHNEKTNNKPG